MTEITTEGSEEYTTVWSISDELDSDGDVRIFVDADNNYNVSAYVSPYEARQLALALLKAAGDREDVEPAVQLAPAALTLDEVKHIAKTVAEETVTEQVATIAREHASREVRRKFRAVISE